MRYRPSILGVGGGVAALFALSCAELISDPPDSYLQVRVVDSATAMPVMGAMLTYLEEPRPDDPATAKTDTLGIALFSWWGFGSPPRGLLLTESSGFAPDTSDMALGSTEIGPYYYQLDIRLDPLASP